MKASKRIEIDRELVRFPEIQEPFDFYRKKLGERHKKPKLKDLAWIVFADYILLKKSVNGLCTCVTCGSENYWNESAMHPGHYRPQGQSNFLRFEEDNVFPCCYRCNVALNGNYREYYKFMIKTVGEARENYLRTTKEKKNWKNYEYADMIAKRWVELKRMKSELDSRRLIHSD